MAKKILFINKHAPYGNTRAHAAFDAIMMAAAYEQEVSMLFMEAGVLQLLEGQFAQVIGQANLATLITALPNYGVKHIYADDEALQRFSLQLSDLVIAVEVINVNKLSALMREHDVVMNF